MKTLDKIVLTLIGIGIGFFGAGCQSTREFKRTNDVAVLQSYPMNNSTITIKPERKGNNRGIEDSIKETENYIAYIEFRKKYSGYGDKILENIKNGNTYTVDKIIKELAGKLEEDPSKYAKDYLKKVKEFSYFSFEEVVTKENTFEKEFKNGSSAVSGVICAPSAVGMIAFEYIFRPVEWVAGTKKGFESEMAESYDDIFLKNKLVNTRVIGTSYKIVKETPYTGKREVIAENITREELDRKMERYKQNEH